MPHAPPAGGALHVTTPALPAPWVISSLILAASGGVVSQSSSSPGCLLVVSIWMSA